MHPSLPCSQSAVDEAIEKLKEVKIDAERKQKVRRRWREGRRGGRAHPSWQLQQGARTVKTAHL